MKFNRFPGILLCLYLAVLCYAPKAVPDTDLPAFFKATYTLQSKGLTLGRMERSFNREANGSYRFSSRSYPTGLARLFRHDRIQEFSIFRIHADDVRPLEYSYDHHGGKKERQVRVIFDWDNSTITNSLGKHHWRMQTVPGVLDKLVYQIALMRHLRQGKTRLRYQIADGGHLKVYSIEIKGEEILQTPLGRIQTIRLQRRKTNSKRQTTLWCAPELDYLPVQVEHREKDGTVTIAQLVELEDMQFPVSGERNLHP